MNRLTGSIIAGGFLAVTALTFSSQASATNNGTTMYGAYGMGKANPQSNNSCFTEDFDGVRNNGSCGSGTLRWDAPIPILYPNNWSSYSASYWYKTECLTGGTVACGTLICTADHQTCNSTGQVTATCHDGTYAASNPGSVNVISDPAYMFGFCELGPSAEWASVQWI